jgi:hypothetical protein
LQELAKTAVASVDSVPWLPKTEYDRPKQQNLRAITDTYRRLRGRDGG